MPEYTYRQERVWCGKKRCGGCPHGPYWYAYWRAGGKVHKRYIGKQLNPETAPPPLGAAPAAPRVPLSFRRAKQLLQLNGTEPYLRAQQRWQWIRKAHQALGEAGRLDLVEVDEAWAVVCAHNKW